MKIELEDKDIERIADIIVARLKPLLSNKKNNKANEWLTVEELAAYIKVNKSWIYEKTYKNEIPFKKAGKFPRFLKSHIDLWMGNPYHSDLDKYNLSHYKGKV